MRLLLSVIVLLAAALPARAQQADKTLPSGTPGIISEGSGNVSVGGAPVARAGDRTTSGDSVAQGSSNVFINGKPAVTMGDGTKCGGVVMGGNSTVFINGKPLARAGDMTSGCK